MTNCSNGNYKFLFKLVSFAPSSVSLKHQFKIIKKNIIQFECDIFVKTIDFLQSHIYKPYKWTYLAIYTLLLFFCLIKWIMKREIVLKGVTKYKVLGKASKYLLRIRKQEMRNRWFSMIFSNAVRSTCYGQYIRKFIYPFYGSSWLQTNY